MEGLERMLRRLALSDEASLRTALTNLRTAQPGDLDVKTEALVQLAALLAIGAGPVSLRWAVELAYAAGASDEELVGVLVAIAPAVGHARVVGVAPDLGLALGFDLEADDISTRREPPTRSPGPAGTGRAYE